MSLRPFFLGLAASFGAAWLAVVVVPYLKMRDLAPIALPQEDVTGTTTVFYPKRASGRIADGAKVYASNGCYLCHSQLVRRTDAGNDLYRPDWGGLANDENRGDTRRETNAYDFNGESYAQIGLTRMGPDLSNLGRRLETRYPEAGAAEAWLRQHLYDPASIAQAWNSKCPPHRHLFTQREVKGNPSSDALPVPAEPGHEWTPGPDARALISYLLSLKKDHPVPPDLDFAPKSKNGDG
jgi:cytochrome c oxidase cbb3-type subunit II